MNEYIILDGWKNNIRFSSAHIIPEYEKCGRIHGHTYAVHIKIYGKPDSKGIIMDFTQVKDVIRKTVNHLDHRILVPGKSNSIKIKKQEKNIIVTFLGKSYSFPEEDCILLPINSTSAENLAKYILNEFIKNIEIPKNINKIEIGVDEGYGQGARISKDI